MRIAFAGTPGFASVALQALVDAGFDVVLVLTQPDRPAGRGLRQSASAVKQLALHLGLHVIQPPTLRDDQIVAQLRTVSARALIVAAYGLILPAAVLELFPFGCINIHASLLPRWRGAAPIQRAIFAGDGETGISIMRMEQGLDTGPVYVTKTLPILPDDSMGSLQDRLAALGGVSITEVLPRIAKGELVPVSQPVNGITYAHKVTKAEAAIDWRKDCLEIDRQIRAFNPHPGAFSLLRSEPVKIWRGRIGAGRLGAPGEIVASGPDGIEVTCGAGVLKITELQKAGGKKLTAAEFLRGWTPARGEHFGY